MHLECESGQYDFACIIRCAWKEEDASEAPGEPPHLGLLDQYFLHGGDTAQAGVVSIQQFAVQDHHAPQALVAALKGIIEAAQGRGRRFGRGVLLRT